MDDRLYQEQCNQVFARIESCVDAWLQDDVIDIDVARTGGMLELVFPDRSKIVVNTQPPLQELWLAARRGGYHFKFADGAWREGKEGQEFFALLSACASEQAAQALTFRAA
jgi:CyaY protein